MIDCLEAVRDNDPYKTALLSPIRAARLRMEVLDHAKRIPEPRRQAHSIPSQLIQDLDEAEEPADIVRHELQLVSAAELARSLEHNGIASLVADLPLCSPSMTFVLDELLPVIVVSRRHGVEQRRFTLARELAAFYIDRQSPVDLTAAKSRFAGALLMPRVPLFIEAKDGFDEGKVIRLSREFGVSTMALLCRLEVLCLTTNWTITDAAAWDRSGGAAARQRGTQLGALGTPRPAVGRLSSRLRHGVAT